MANNENESVSAVINAAAGKSSKPRKSKSTTRKASSASSSRSAAVQPAAASEILFTEDPNPYLSPAPPYIWIDFPQQNERLLGPLYNIRMVIGGAQAAEISIDGGPWLTCRLTSGYWWYDWAAIKPGKHTLTARMRTPDGRWYRTPVRHCEYRP